MNDAKLIIEEGLIDDGQTVVLGLSGGPDSVCLLYELLAAGSSVVCAHVNHGLRGEESDGDEAYVRALCEGLGVTLEAARIDAAALAKENGLTVEEAGREARYAFFDEVGESIGGDVCIAVAHNKDDQAETVLMRILRGTGTDGLAGMAKVRKSAAGLEIVRPLLSVTRQEIEKKLTEYGEIARKDGSNEDTVYLRNKIRLEVFPYLEETLGVKLTKSLTRLSENAAEDKDFFDTVIEEALNEHLVYAEEGQESAQMPAELLAGVHPAVRHRLIRQVFAELGLIKDVAAVHLAAADSLLETWRSGGEATGKRVEFPQDYTFGIAGKMAVFRAPGVVEPGWKPARKL